MNDSLDCSSMALTGPSVGTEHSESAAVQAELEKQVADGLIAGGVCGLNAGPLYYAGRLRRTPTIVPMRPDALFDLASVGKTFTASLCALLYAQGRLDPDAPFTKYLPEHVLAKENCDITVRDLAMHSGGFDNDKPYIDPDPCAFDAKLYAKRPCRPRGEKFVYVCSNAIYLGKIVEHITGLDLESAAVQMLWRPLGMEDTVWHAIPGNVRVVETEQNGHPPIGFKGDEQARAYGAALGNGAAFSCVSDMLTFVRDLCDRKTFPKEYYDLLFTCRFDRDGARRSFGWNMSLDSTPKGWSPNTISHGGFTGNTIAVDPDHGWAGVVLTNRTGERLAGYAGHYRLLSLLSES